MSSLGESCGVSAEVETTVRFEFWLQLWKGSAMRAAVAAFLDLLNLSTRTIEEFGHVPAQAA